MRRYSFEVSSELSARPDEFWARATLSGVNKELSPWVRMTAPPEWRSIPLLQWTLRKRLFNSWLLLFGIIPVDLHYFYMHNVTPNVGFEERSSSAMNKHWDHTRRIEPTPRGCVLTDRVEYESRLPFIGVLFLPIYKAIFVSRHRYLRRVYGRIASS